MTANKEEAYEKLFENILKQIDVGKGLCNIITFFVFRVRKLVL